MAVFKTYKEEYIGDQVKLIREATKDWNGFYYPNKEKIKEIYENVENLSPETRHYAFENNELIGFLASAVEGEFDGITYGSIQYPFVKEGNEELRDILMKKAIETLQAKNVQIIQTYIYEDWADNVFAKIKKYGYDDGTVVRRYVRFMPKDLFFPDFEKPKEIREVDSDKDMELLIKAYETVGQYRPIIINWKESERLVSNAIIRENDDIIAHGMFDQVADNPKRGDMSHIAIFKEGKDHLRLPMFKYLINKANEAEIGETVLHVADDTYEPFYVEMGLTFLSIYCYEIKL
ncbi:MAG: hypothetical protein FK733_16890 [Asgard group archaeon]|nr:hypothetical protein [Asgard group archaeon]